MSYLDKLNLRPAEKRLVVLIGLVLFVVLNLIFVFPFFSEWGKTQARMAKAERTLGVFKQQIEQRNKYEVQVKALESEGLDVAFEEQAVQFIRVIQNQAAQSGVNVTGSSRATTRTNQFFIEQSQTINLQAGEKQLVDFLYSLGAGNSLVRVRDLSLGPDATRQNLVANITLVASYQKKSAPRLTQPPATATRTNAPPLASSAQRTSVSNRTNAPAAAATPVRTSATPLRASAPTNRPTASTNAAAALKSTAKRP
jgi:Tfp pilus assembly protein PilO